MAKTKIERISGIDEQIKQLENQRKQLLQQHKEQERKDRTKRLCKRAGLFEKMLPDTITLTDEQFQTLMEKTMLTPFTRRILDELTAQNTATATPQGAKPAKRDNPAPSTKPAESTPQSGTGAGTNEGESARVSD